MRRLCTICARGGSKGVPGKNLAPVLGVPLIAHSIRHAQESGLFDAVAVSSDDPAILDAAAAHGADLCVRRPAELARDDSPKLPAIRHCVGEAERALGAFDVVVDLDATSPLRTADDVRGAVALLESSGADNVITGTPAHRSPYFNMVELRPDGSVALAKSPPAAVARRQDAPPCYDMNASIYVWRRAALDAGDAVVGPRTRLYEMPRERSLDVDSPLDLEMVEWLMRRAAGPAGGATTRTPR